MNSIRSKLLCTFGGIVFIFALAMGGYALTALTNATHVQDNYRQDVAAAVHLTKAQDAVWALRWGFAQYIALGDGNPEGRAKVLDADPKHFQTVTNALSKYGASDLSVEEAAGVKTLQAAFTQYYEARAPWFKLMGQGKTAEAAELRARTTTPFGAATVKALVAQFELQQKTAEARLAEAVKADSQLMLFSVFAKHDHKVICAHALRIFASPQTLHPDERHPVRDNHVRRVHLRSKFGRIMRFHYHVHRSKAHVCTFTAFG